MVDAASLEVARARRRRDFIQEALASDAAIEGGAAVYNAEEVHAWLLLMAKGKNPPRPAPWRMSLT